MILQMMHTQLILEKPKNITVNTLEMEIKMKVKDAYLYTAVSIARLVNRITRELNAAEFEAEAPDLSEEERAEARQKVKYLSSNLRSFEIMMDLGERYETDF